MNYAIYYDHELPNGSLADDVVLLIDGAWTNQNNCNRREIYNAERDGNGIVMHKPKLFATAGGARNHLKTVIGIRPCYRIDKYTGPTDPMSRPAKVY